MKNSTRSIFVLLILAGCRAETQQQTDHTQNRTEHNAPETAIRDTAGSITHPDGPADDHNDSAQQGKDPISEAASKKYSIEGGRAIVYVAPDGAGGYENEGQALYRYEPGTGIRKKLLAEYYAIVDVREHSLPDGSAALLVTMADGGLGASHIAVVHPQKGQVFRDQMCKIGAVSGDKLTLHYYTAWAWGVLNEGKPASVAKVKPFKTKVFSISELLRSPVIVNKNSNEG